MAKVIASVLKPTAIDMVIALAWTYLYFWINADTILCIKKHSDFSFTCLSN